MGIYHGPRLWLLIMTIKSFYEITSLSLFSNLSPKARHVCSSSALIHCLPLAWSLTSGQICLVLFAHTFAFGTHSTGLRSPGSSPRCHLSLPRRTYDIFLLSSVTSKQPVSLVINTCSPSGVPSNLGTSQEWVGGRTGALLDTGLRIPALSPVFPAQSNSLFFLN